MASLYSFVYRKNAVQLLSSDMHKAQSGELVYPELYYSYDYKSILEKRPDLPSEPTKPENPTFKLGFWSTIGILACIGYLVFGLIRMIQDGEDGSLIVTYLFVFGIPIALILIHARKKFKQEENEYKYNLRAYESNLRRCREAKERLLSPEYLLSYRNNLLKKWLSDRESGVAGVPSFRYTNNTDVVRRGVSEESFYRQLKTAGLPYEISTNLKIPTEFGYYYPDIVIVTQGIFIDIEIDEPYSEEDGTPIHYFESLSGNPVSIDNRRNKVLSTAGWEIIRFAEEQVVNYPSECIACIKEVIESILTGGAHAPFITSKIVVKKWSEGQASYYALNKYRDTYLHPLQ